MQHFAYIKLFWQPILWKVLAYLCFGRQIWLKSDVEGERGIVKDLPVIDTMKICWKSAKL